MLRLDLIEKNSDANDREARTVRRAKTSSIDRHIAAVAARHARWRHSAVK